MTDKNASKLACMKSGRVKLGLLAVAVMVVISGCQGGSKDPSESELFQEGVALYNANSYSKAAAIFTRQLNSYPAGTLADDAVFYLGRSQYWLGDYSHAIAGFDSIKTTYPDSNVAEAAVYWKGKAQQKSGDFVTARQTYQFIIDENTVGRFTTDYVGDAHYSIAKSYYDAADYAAAINEFNLARSNIVSTVSATDSKLDNIQYYLARSYHKQLNYTQANAEYDLLIATYDGLTPETTSGWVGNAKVQKGVIYIDQLDYVGAEGYFQTLMADTAFAASRDGDLGQYTFAGIYYDQAKAELALATPNVTVYGPLLIKARTEYQKVITNYPTSSWADNALYQIGKSHYDEANYANALTSLKQVSANYPGSSSADSADYYVGRTLQKQAGIAKADADAAAALAGTPPDYSGAAGFLALNGSARNAYARVMQLYPASTIADNAQYQLATTYYDEALYPNARTEFAKVVADYPLSSYADNAQYYLGRAFHKDSAALNYLVDARTAYGRVLSLYPASTKVENAEYYSARTYHDAAGGLADCQAELAAMQAFELKYPASAHLATVQTHIADLLLIPSTVTHVCI